MRLSEVELVGRDLDGQRRFYGGVLGLEAVMEDGRLAVRAGRTRLLFSPDPDLQDGPLGQHLAFNVPPGQFEEARDWAASRVDLIPDSSGETAFFSQDWNAQILYFHDADGNILELIARHTLNGTFPDAPFGPGSLLGVSEVGVASPDPGELAGRLEGLGLTRYRDPPLENTVADFIPLGDEEGLLIVVREGRPWFPTAQPARSRPLRAEMEAPDLRLLAPGPSGTPPQITRVAR